MSGIPPSSLWDGQLPARLPQWMLLAGGEGGLGNGASTSHVPGGLSVYVPITGSPGCRCQGGCHWLGAGSPGRGLWCVPSWGTQGGKGSPVSIRGPSPPVPRPEMPGRLSAHVLPNTLLGGFHMGPIPPRQQSSRCHFWKRGAAEPVALLWVAGRQRVPRGLIRKLRLCHDLSFSWDTAVALEVSEQGEAEAGGMGRTEGGWWESRPGSPR